MNAINLFLILNTVMAFIAGIGLSKYSKKLAYKTVAYEIGMFLLGLGLILLVILIPYVNDWQAVYMGFVLLVNMVVIFYGVLVYNFESSRSPHENYMLRRTYKSFFLAPVLFADTIVLAAYISPII
jgi:uncharacterized membrane protein